MSEHKDPRDAWLDQCQAYYRDQYPKAMRHKVREILPSDPAKLKALMDIVIADEGAWKRSVKVPGVDAVRAGLREMYQMFPEFQATAIDADTVLLLEDASPSRDAKVAEGFEHFMGAMRRGQNPAKDPDVLITLHELGYEVEG